MRGLLVIKGVGGLGLMRRGLGGMGAEGIVGGGMRMGE